MPFAECLRWTLAKRLLLRCKGLRRLFPARWTTCLNSAALVALTGMRRTLAVRQRACPRPTPSLRITGTPRTKSTTSRLGRRTAFVSNSLMVRRCLRAKAQRPQPRPQPSFRSWARSSTHSPLGFWTSKRLAVTGSKCLRTPWAKKRKPPSTRSWMWLRLLQARPLCSFPALAQPLSGLWAVPEPPLRVRA